MGERAGKEARAWAAHRRRLDPRLRLAHERDDGPGVLGVAGGGAGSGRQPRVGGRGGVERPELVPGRGGAAFPRGAKHLSHAARRTPRSPRSSRHRSAASTAWRSPVTPSSRCHLPGGPDHRAGLLRQRRPRPRPAATARRGRRSGSARRALSRERFQGSGDRVAGEPRSPAALGCRRTITLRSSRADAGKVRADEAFNGPMPRGTSFDRKRLCDPCTVRC